MEQTYTDCKEISQNIMYIKNNIIQKTVEYTRKIINPRQMYT